VEGGDGEDDSETSTQGIAGEWIRKAGASWSSCVLGGGEGLSCALIILVARAEEGSTVVFTRPRIQTL
jgi:hypothetical protein